MTPLKRKAGESVESPSQPSISSSLLQSILGEDVVRSVVSSGAEIILDGPIRIRSPSLSNDGNDEEISFSAVGASQGFSSNVNTIAEQFSSISSSAQTVSEYIDLRSTEGTERSHTSSIDEIVDFSVSSGDILSIGQHKLTIIDFIEQNSDNYVWFQWNDSEKFLGRVLLKRSNGLWKILWKEDESITNFLNPLICRPLYTDADVSSGIRISFGPVSQPLIVPMTTEVSINNGKQCPLYMFV